MPGLTNESETHQGIADQQAQQNVSREGNNTQRCVLMSFCSLKKIFTIKHVFKIAFFPYKMANLNRV